jgi:hypothetical protein
MKTFVPNFKFFLVASIFAASICSNSVNAQTPALEFAAGAGNPTGNGPTVANQVITFQTNTNNPSGNTFVAYSPTLTATFSLSNQQYSLPTSEISTGKGLSFGATQSNSSSSAPASALFALMNSISTPSNSNFTSSTAVTAGTGIDISVNKAVGMFTTTRALYNANASTSGRYYFGNLTITFNQTVTNPILQIVGMGGYYSSLGFTNELELQTSGIVLSKFSGSSELSVSSGTKILNSAAHPNSPTGSGAASGSVLASGSGISSLTFKIYLRGDGGDFAWGGSGNHQGDVWFIGVSLNPPVNLSGNVYIDKDGLTNNKVDGTGTGLPGGTQVYANLLNSSNIVLASTAVSAGGTYSFPRIASNTNYIVQLSTNQGTSGLSAPATALPSGWANTGENIGNGSGNDGTVNGLLPVTVATSDVTNANFGIERLPNSDAKWYAITDPAMNSSMILNGSGLVPGALSGADAEDGTLGSSKRVAITSLPTNNNQLWYNGVQIKFGADGINPPSVSNPYIIVSYNPALLSIKFTGAGSKKTTFNYAYYDAALLMDASPATYELNWNIPLPVKLVSFTATLNNSIADLKWATATEINTSFFVIEKSANGTDYTEAGIVFAKGNAGSITNYSFSDNVTGSLSDFTYYRLRTVDIDGNSGLSETRIIKTGKQGISNISIAAYPNPVTTELRITIPAEWQNKKVMYEVIAANGLVAKRTETVNNNQVEALNVSSLAPGFYVVRVSCNGQTGQQRIVKQ